MSESTTQDVQFWRGAYEEHGGALLAFLRHRVGNRQDAEDLLQDVFIRVINTDSELRNPARVKSYLFSTAYNLTINHFRRRRFDDLPGSDDENGGNPFDQVPDTDRLGPDDEAEWMDLNEHVLVSMETLNDRYKTAFQYGVLEGRPYNEISRLTGWTTAQVKVNIHRSRKAMIDCLRDRGVLEVEGKALV